MGNDSFDRLGRRRDRKRRNRMIVSGVLALFIAGAGATGAVLAFRGTGAAPRPASTSTPSPETSTSPSPTGQTSVTQPRLAPPSPSGPIQAAGDGDYWYVGPNGEIIAKLGDGPEQGQYSGPLKVTALQFVDEQHGWALAEQGRLRSADAAAHWTAAGEPADPVRSLQFLTSDLGWGISGPPNTGGEELPGKLVRSDDGGMTWSEVTPTPEHPSSICFVDGEAGWFATGTRVFRTLDGGQSWDATGLDVPAGEPWTATVGCSSKSEAWVLLTDGGAAGHVAYVVFRTSDGTTWKPVLQEAGTSPVGSQEGAYASMDPYPGTFTVTGPNTAAFVTWCPPCGNSVSLLRTDDSGKVLGRLDVAAPDKGGEPLGVTFTDPNHGWILLMVQTNEGPGVAVAKIEGSSVVVST